MSNLNFTPQQQAAIRHLDGDLLVSAAAGSGKTRVLVERLMEQVEAGADLDRFLIITYTRAAAAELKGRILEEINRRLGLSPSRHLRRQSALVYKADIGTIHSFCAKLIRAFPHVAKVSPDFRVADESEAGLLLRAALEDSLEARYNEPEGFPGFLALADSVSEGRQDSLLGQTVLDVHKKLLSHPYPAQWAKERLREMGTEEKTEAQMAGPPSQSKDAAETIWGAYLLKESAAALDHWLREMAEAREEMKRDPAFEKAYGPSWDETLGALARFVVAAKRGWDAAYACMPIAFPRPKAVRGREPQHERWKDLRRRCKSAAEKLEEPFSMSSKDIFEDIEATAPLIAALLALALDVDRAYKAEKTRRGMLDFSDLEHLAIALLVDPESGGPTQIAGELASRYRELMVDEFQDVSPVQDLLFRALGEHGLRRFLVGDLKQSIYRFRLADPGIFLGYYRRFPDIEQTEAEGGKTVLLGKNFRSGPGILDAVNFLFRRLMSEAFAEMDYGDREALYPGLPETMEDGPPVSLDILDLKELPKDGSDAREMREARHVAAEIRRLHEESGYPWGDFAILLRSVSGKAARYEKALEEQGIPLVKSGRDNFFYTAETASVIALLRVILNPFQDVPLLSAMRSPLFCFSPDELAEIRLRDQSVSFFEALEAAAEESEKCARFLEDLDRFRNAAPDMSTDAFLWYLYSETAALSLFGAMEDGETKRAHLLALLAFARKTQAAGYRSLFDFVSLLEKREEAGDSPEIAGPRGREGAVTIMSIHKSKGLEFPVVILPDLSKQFNLKDISRQILVHPQLGLGALRRDLERKICYSTLPRLAVGKKLRREMLAEELRVLYVAMTRARERLILTAALNDADKTLDALALSAGEPLSPYALESASSMAQWILQAAITRPEAEILRGEYLLPLAKTAYPWSIRLLSACAEMEQTAAQERKTDRDLHGEPPGETAEPDPELIRRIRYVYPFPQAVDLPSKLTATELKGRALDLEASEEAEAHPAPPSLPPLFRKPAFLQADRPLTGAQRGTAAHLLMQHIDFKQCRSLQGIKKEITRLAQEGRILKEDAQAVDSASIWSFFESALGQRVLRAKQIKREFKFSLLVPASDFYPGAGEEEILLQGVIDCCVEEPGGWVLIDFKTDFVPAGSLAEKAREYHGQMAAYAYALNRVTGLPTKESYLYFFSAKKAVLLPPSSQSAK